MTTGYPIQKQKRSHWVVSRDRELPLATGEQSERAEGSSKREKRMEALAGRRVRSGKEYDALFPLPNGKDDTIKKSADVNDTVNFIRKIVPLTLDDTKKIAALKKGRTLEETCRNYWQFVYRHVPYKRDKDGVEQVRRPARTWWDRNHADEEGKVGVDCDCYTVFLSSMLTNAGIPHKYRITKYPKRPPEVPAWQHIYIVVPRDGKPNRELRNRSDYIVMDCVKNAYDDEQPYLEAKDYDMRLDYLNGIDREEEYQVPKETDAQDLAAIYDEEDLGKLGQWLKKAEKNVGNEAGKAFRTFNKIADPATILLRNGVLLSMKENILNVAKRLRYAYLSDTQALKMGMNPEALKVLRKIKDKIETIYWQAGGKKENFQKAVLSGKGNKDKKVQLAGLFGVEEEYADQDEYNIIHSTTNGLEGLGVLPAAAMAAATAAIATISKVLSQVKGLFSPGSPEEKSMATNTPDPSGDATDTSTTTTTDDNATTTTSAAARTAVPAQYRKRSASATPISQSQSDTSSQEDTGDAQDAGNSDTQKNNDNAPKGLAWAKANPLPATLIVAGALTGGYLLIKTMNHRKSENPYQPRTAPLNGTTERRTRKRKKKAVRKPIRKIKAIRIN